MRRTKKSPRLDEITDGDMGRFWEKVHVRGPGECWEWLAGLGTGNGYGKFSLRNYPWYAHRFSFWIANKRMPENMVLHTCDNRVCVNPSHLYDGTEKDNSRDAVERGRIPLGEQHYLARLRASDVAEIKAAYRDMIDEFSRRFNVDKSTIGDIARGTTWKHIRPKEHLS